MKTKTKSPFTTLLDLETQTMLEELAANQGCNKAQIVRAAIRYHFGMLKSTGRITPHAQDLVLAQPNEPTQEEITHEQP